GDVGAPARGRPGGLGMHETARISRHSEFSQAQIFDHLALTNDRIDLDFTVTSSRGARHYIGKGREKEDEDNFAPECSSLARLGPRRLEQGRAPDASARRESRHCIGRVTFGDGRRGTHRLVERFSAIAARVEALPLDAAAEVLVLLEPAVAALEREAALALERAARQQCTRAATAARSRRPAADHSATTPHNATRVQPTSAAPRGRRWRLSSRRVTGSARSAPPRTAPTQAATP